MRPFSNEMLVAFYGRFDIAHVGEIRTWDPDIRYAGHALRVLPVLALPFVGGLGRIVRIQHHIQPVGIGVPIQLGSPPEEHAPLAAPRPPIVDLGIIGDAMDSDTPSANEGLVRPLRKPRCAAARRAETGNKRLNLRKCARGCAERVGDCRLDVSLRHQRIVQNGLVLRGACDRLAELLQLPLCRGLELGDVGKEERPQDRDPQGIAAIDVEQAHEPRIVAPEREPAAMGGRTIHPHHPSVGHDARDGPGIAESCLPADEEVWLRNLYWRVEGPMPSRDGASRLAHEPVPSRAERPADEEPIEIFEILEEMKATAKHPHPMRMPVADVGDTELRRVAHRRFTVAERRQQERRAPVMGKRRRLRRLPRPALSFKLRRQDHCSLSLATSFGAG